MTAEREEIVGVHPECVCDIVPVQDTDELDKTSLCIQQAWRLLQSWCR